MKKVTHPIPEAWCWNWKKRIKETKRHMFIGW